MTPFASPSPREGRGFGGSAPVTKPTVLQIVTAVTAALRSTWVNMPARALKSSFHFWMILSVHC